MEGLGSSGSLTFLVGHITLDRSLDLRLGPLIGKTLRNTVLSGLPQTCQEVIIIKLTPLQVQIPKIFSKHLLPVKYKAFAPIASLYKSSFSGVGDNNGEGVSGRGINDTKLAVR